jgi:hypothetical protein
MSSSDLSPIVQAFCAAIELATPEVLGPILGSAFTRNASPVTTTVYPHPSDQEMAGRVRRLEC